MFRTGHHALHFLRVEGCPVGVDKVHPHDRNGRRPAGTSVVFNHFSTNKSVIPENEAVSQAHLHHLVGKKSTFYNRIFFWGGVFIEMFLYCIKFLVIHSLLL